ncbi:histidine kinase [Plantactinospora sp. B24E8]|uniref:sensor histidine kinase n=1 Tax=Plantactinospora sp. B24E8 TaxID=3153567 RepID=UPI00325E4079
MAAWRNLERGTMSRDIVLASASYLGGLLLLAVYHPLNEGILDPPAGVSLALLTTTSVAVALRRVATRTGLTLGTVAFLIDLACGSSLATTLVYTQVLFDACVYGPPRMWRWLLWINIALTGLAAALGMIFLGPWSWHGLALAVPVALIGVLPVVSGIGVRQYRDQAAAERARAEQTARLAELDRRQAVAAERSRMARELHDVVANHLSAVAIHATAVLSVSSLDRAQVEQALRVIRENSVQGLAEMRQMIGLLREPAESAETGADRDVPAPLAVDGPVRPRLAEVDRLVDQARGAGLPLRFETLGEPEPLPVGVDLAAYRIVQEALTNALKHGTGPATLTVAHRPGSVRLTIENRLARGATGAPGADRTPAGTGLPGAGAGLIGMRERVALLHGRFTAGPCDHGWRVSAELPVAERTHRTHPYPSSAPA